MPQHGISTPLANFSKNLTDQLSVLGLELAQDTQKRFFKQDQNWKPLKAETKKRKKLNKDKILVETGKLRDEISYNVQRNILSIGSPSKYARAQDLGYSQRNLPARPFLFLDEKQKQFITKYLKRIM